MNKLAFFAFGLLSVLAVSCGSDGSSSEPEGMTKQDSIQYLDDILLPTLEPFGIGFSMVTAVNNYEVLTATDSTFENQNMLADLTETLKTFDASIVQAIDRVSQVEEIDPDIALKEHSISALQAFKDYSDQVCIPFVESAQGGFNMKERAAISEARRGLDVRTPLEMFQLAQEAFAKTLNMPQDSIGTLMSRYQIKPL